MTTPSERIDLAKLSDETHLMGTAHDIAEVLGRNPTTIVTMSQSICLTNAEARRLLALAVKGVKAEQGAA